MSFEERERSDEFINAFKLALVSADPDRFSDVFMPPEAAIEAVVSDEQLEADLYGGQSIEWDFTEAMSAEEAMRIMGGDQPSELMEMSIEELEREREPKWR